jgi:hypothetical protein
MANPGDLDTSFDGNGKKAINFGGTDAARVVLVQPNGRIVVAGGGAAAGSFCVARLSSRLPARSAATSGLRQQMSRSAGKSSDSISARLCSSN